jgi:phage terminase large subunit GpA-like protein
LTAESQARFDHFVRCPPCGAFHTMQFSRIRWPGDLREPEAVESGRLAWYECAACPARWDDEWAAAILKPALPC